MACIGCGLGVNADGKGRVDIDTVGGLECNGSAGGTSNTSGRGVRIKVADTAGNQVQVGPAGLYVPQPAPIEIYTDNETGGAVTGGGAVPWTSPTLSIPITNNTQVDKVFMVNTNMRWGYGATGDVIGRLSLSLNGPAFWAAESIQPDGVLQTPISIGGYVLRVSPGQTATVSAIMTIGGPVEVTVPSWGLGLTIIGGAGVLTRFDV
jgi:hypothetical protein